MVYRACKKDIGELPDVNTETIKQWIMVDGLIDTEIKAKYQLLYDDTLPNMRKAKKLLAELRRDEGDCHKIGELRALKWIEDKFDMKDIIKSYRYHITEAKLFGRAEALRYRLQDELKCRDVPSILELRILFHNNLNDNAIAAYYLEKISRPSKEEITAAGVSSLIDTRPKRGKHLREYHPALSFRPRDLIATLAPDPIDDSRLPQDKVTMTNNGEDSATPQLTRIPMGDWSRSEYLFIQLQSELSLAVTSLPVRPRHIDDGANFIAYREFFASFKASPEKSPKEAGNDVVKGVPAFIHKRDELSGFVMWALRQNLAVANKDPALTFNSVQVTLDMLQDYRQFRERLGFDTYLHDPRLWPELWKFLQDAARKQFPEFSGDATQAVATQDGDNNDHVDVDMDSSPIVGPVPANDMAAASDHSSVDGEEIPSADADADEEGDAEDAAAEDDEDDEDSGTAQPETRQGPDDFALETGTVRCTAWSKESNSRCKRHARNENEDRRSWRCHNHDPARKAVIKADRLARNRAAKAGKKAEKDGVAKPKQQKKKAGRKAAK
ncbi:hypothetical protein ACET3X_002006 [Alternaria dauci]|uniref:Uncharacterized protein n=1 Tax=Alternaria dauci TaxID=48095 RepID=A0ABR3V0L8_9PLEO